MISRRYFFCAAIAAVFKSFPASKPKTFPVFLTGEQIPRARINMELVELLKAMEENNKGLKQSLESLRLHILKKQSAISEFHHSLENAS